ncbi:MAG: hypothetical protein AB8B60_07245 [Sulfitobacter sp.]
MNLAKNFDSWIKLSTTSIFGLTRDMMQFDPFVLNGFGVLSVGQTTPPVR